jgi:hypothetical protein
MKKFAIDIHSDKYACIALSTSHLTQNDKDKLTNTATTDCGMIMERDTGYFIKLYVDKEYTLYLIDNLSQEAQDVIMACHNAGFQLIEFDRDADELLEYV